MPTGKREKRPRMRRRRRCNGVKESMAEVRAGSASYEKSQGVPDRKALLFRTDADPGIGMGHLMRCLSIADAAREKGVKCMFLCSRNEAAEVAAARGFKTMILSAGQEHGAPGEETDTGKEAERAGSGVMPDEPPEEGTDTGKAAERAKRPAPWYGEAELPYIGEVLRKEMYDAVIVDSYAVTDGYLGGLHEICAGRGITLAYIDDVAAFAYPCDILINYNIYAPDWRDRYESLYTKAWQDQRDKEDMKAVRKKENEQPESGEDPDRNARPEEREAGEEEKACPEEREAGEAIKDRPVEVAQRKGQPGAGMGSKVPVMVLGVEYAPLRKEFASDGHREIREQATDVLISTGGADTEHLGIALLREIRKRESSGRNDEAIPGRENSGQDDEAIPERENSSQNDEAIPPKNEPSGDTQRIVFHMVVGRMSRDVQELRREAALSRNIRLHFDVTDMARLMRSCDAAISASGSTLCELSATQTPALTYILADNQIAVAKGFAGRGVMKCCGDVRQLGTEGLAGKLVDEVLALCRDYTARREIAERMRKITDARGAERIVEAILGAKPQM